LAAALENCRLSVVFGLGRESAELQAKQIGKADPLAIKEQALTDTQHAQYLTIPEQFESWTEEVQNLSPRMAYVKLHDADAAKIKTLTVPDAEVNPRELDEVLASYKREYQRTQEEAEAAIARLTPPASGEGEAEAPPAYTTLFRRGKEPEEQAN
jgi:hypothetical protein